MLSLFWVLVCVLAQLSNNTVHAAVIVASNICPNGFIGLSGLLIIKFVTNASERDPGRDLRTVHDSVKQKAVVIVVSPERPVTNLCEDGTGEVDTDYAFDLPH